MTNLSELRSRHTAEALTRAPAMIERLSWDAERLAAHRTQALRELVSHAATHSPWHRKRLAGVDVGALEVSSLAELPVMRKPEVMAHFDDVVTDRRLRLTEVEAALADPEGSYLFDRYTAVASGGSSGRRGVFVYDWEGWPVFWLSLFRGLMRERADDPTLADRTLTMGFVFAAHASHVSSAVARTFADPALVTLRFPVTLPVHQIVAGLNEAQPDILAGYPSILHVLADEATAGRLRIAPRRVFSGGEPLLPEIRAAVHGVWPVPLTNWWASSEAGCSMLPCRLGTSHLAEDLGIYEPVDALGHPVPPGERAAKIYVTNLFNRAMPLIRWEITDEITILAEPCPCGAPTPAVADVQGRLDDAFAYADVSVHPHVFRSALGRLPEILEYQVRQTARGAQVVVVCSGNPDLDALRREIESHISKAGVPAPEVAITTAPTLDRLAQTGKLSRFIPLH